MLMALRLAAHRGADGAPAASAGVGGTWRWGRTHGRLPYPRIAGNTVGTLRAMGDRYRCTACGNLTRFDVVVRQRSRAYYHFSVAGELSVEDESVLERDVEQVTCRWCNATGTAIEVVAPAGAAVDE